MSDELQAQPPPSDGNQIAPILTETRTAQTVVVGVGVGAKLGSAQAMPEAKLGCLALRTESREKKERCLEETQARRPTSTSLQECRRKSQIRRGVAGKW